MAKEQAIHFDRFGRTYQLRIRDAAGLEDALELDNALWIATSAPVAALNCDERFLRFVDADGNGYIRCDELRTAIRWLLDRLSDVSRLHEGADELRLGALNGSDAGGRTLVETARYVLRFLGAPGTDSISLAQIESFERMLDNHPINGDGVIPPGAAEDEGVARFIRDIVASGGGTEDRTGRVGITEDDLERFLSDAVARLAWLARAEESKESDEIRPLGPDTSDAYAAYEAVRPKVDEFFARCRAVRFGGSGAGAGAPAIAAGQGEEEPTAEAIDAALRRAPLAPPNADGILPLQDEVNPVYTGALERLRKLVVRRVIGERKVIRWSEWQSIKTFFAPHKAWLDSEPGGSVAGFDRETLREYVDGPYADAVRTMLAEDREVAERLAAVQELLKLLLYHRHLMELANNFVSFPDLYDPARRAIFERGSLVIDGRWFNFATRVENREEHARVARTSRMYVMYVEVRKQDGATKTLVAVPATSGTAGNLCVGKRGVFVDTDGEHHEARVVEIIENPISFREALVSPFVRLGRFIVGKIEAMSAGAQKELEAQVGQAAQQVQQGVEETARQPTQPSQQQPTAGQTSASRRDLLVGASVSIAALSSACAFIT
ncbi:MAG: hypothetical protein PVJ27_08290, partial [Candidatus Brocadiaceae bacterium]